ncbi:MAG: Tim44 domain-containing protein [Elusimicrobia bacterium]|nr:Tim44 domain-containing protein [Elusimicrobiota bacterium]
MRALALLCLLVLAAPSAVESRAGGGDSFSSGSSRSSSFGSGSSSFGSGSLGGYRSSSRSRSYSSAHHRYSGKTSNTEMVVVIALFLVFMYIKHSVEGGWESSSPSVYSAPMPSPAAVLMPEDPAFDKDRFLARSQAAFALVQKAWSEGDMTPVCHLLSDGVFERFQLLLELQRREGRINRLEGLEVRDIRLARADPGGRYDCLDVRIEASCRDAYFSAKDGSLLSESDSRFVEYWSFVRSVAARSRQGAGTVEGLCPNCGSALSVNRSAVCANCKGWVNSGEFDWVLAEITQDGVYGPRTRDRERLAVLGHDPEATPQSLEDRASMLFWRWQRCLADRSEAALEGWCADSGIEAVLASGLGRARYVDCGVGTVDLTTVELDEGFEAVNVAVVWDGRQVFDEAPPGPPRRRRTFITLARQAGAKTVPNSGLRSGHCSGCGAGIPPAAPVCEHCGKGFKDPAVDWVVTGLRTVDV